MKCADYKNMIPEYISGELENSLRSDLEKHLSGCRSCAEFFEQEKKILLNIEYDNFSVPNGLNSNVIDNLPAHKSQPFMNIFTNNIKFFYAAASVVMIIIVAAVVRNAYFVNGNSDYIFDNETVYTSAELLGEGYDDVIYSSDLYDKEKWSSDSSEIFSSDNEIVNGMITLEELESYDNYLSSL